MLLAEDPLDLLVDRLRELPASDRRGVLVRLSLPERRRLEAALGRAPADSQPRFAADIAARMAAPTSDPALTEATRAVLKRIAGGVEPAVSATPSLGPSLFGRLGDALRRR